MAKSSAVPVQHQCKLHTVIPDYDLFKANMKFSKPMISRQNDDNLQTRKKGFKKDLPALPPHKVFHWPLNFGKNYQLISKTLAQTVLVNKLNSIYYVSNLIFKDHFKIGLSFFPLCFIVL